MNIEGPVQVFSCEFSEIYQNNIMQNNDYSWMLMLRKITNSNYNYGHNITGIFDALPNSPFTTSKTKADC